MPKYVIVARDPNGQKVTTISAHVGKKAVPFGWEWILCKTQDVPMGKELNQSWSKLALGKKVEVSTSERIPLEAVDPKRHAAVKHITDIYKHRNELLQMLDVDWIRADEKPTTYSERKRAISKFKEDLRNLELSLDDFSTDEEVIKYWPEVFSYTIEDYMPLEKRIAPLVIAFIIIMVLSAGIPLTLLFL